MTGLPKVLGWLSAGLGAGELAVPGAIGRWLGVPEGQKLIRAMGARELLSAAGLLGSSRGKSRWLWARTGGDAIDLAVLGRALKSPGARTGPLLMVAGLVLGVLVLDTYAAWSD